MSRPLPRLVAITDAHALGAEQLLARVQALVDAAQPESVAVLLRDHELSGRARLELGGQLRRLTRAAGHELWVADRVDLALLLEADGLHLGEGSVTAAVGRRLLGDERRVSRAWHRARVEASDRDELAGVDALLLSPIFAPRKGRQALEASALTELARGLAHLALGPAVYALGGVTANDVTACDAAGAAGVAAIGAALGPDQRALLRALGIERA